MGDVPARQPRGMTPPREPTRLELEVRFDEEPIRGRLVVAGALDRPFSGWLGLMAAIEAAGREDAGAGGELR